MSYLNIKIEDVNPHEVARWAFENDILLLVRDTVINPTTFKPTARFQVKREKDKTAVLLRWK